MKTVGFETAVSRLAKTFKAEEWKENEDRPEPSFYIVEKHKVTFFISIGVFSHQTALKELQGFFAEKHLPKGSGCRILPATHLYTRFVLEKDW